MKEQLVMTGPGTCRGYHVTDSGQLEVITYIPVIDFQPVDNYCRPYTMSGPLKHLIGWPDRFAVEVSPTLLIAIK